MAKKKTTGRRKKIPLNQFKAWLDGVEELQPDDWHPDKTQWDLIRTKIDSIVDTPLAVAPEQQIRPGLQQPQQMRPGLQQPQPVGTNGQGQPIQVPMVGDTTPPASPVLMPQQGVNQPPIAKTAEIDTSDGNYNSGFA